MDTHNLTYTPAQAAARLDVNQATIYLWIKRGIITAKRIGPKLLRIDGSEIARLLAAPAQPVLAEDQPEA